MMNIIELNTKEIPAQAINGCRTVIDIWTTLQTRYEGSGAVLQYNLLMDWVNIKLEDYSSLKKFIIAYTKSIDKLDRIQGMSVPEKWQPLKSPLDQQGTLFDTGAKHHIVDSIENLNPGTFQPANLPPVDTAKGLQKPLGYGKRTLICATDDENRTFTLELNKVQVLPKYGINIFGAKDLLGEGRIGIIDRNLVVDIKERPLFRFNKKMMIIKAYRTYAFPAVTPAPKETSIRLWHRRFGHLELENQDPRNNQNLDNEIGSSPKSDPKIDVEEELDMPEGDSDDGIKDLPDMPQEEEEV
ncbi:hypothetical protein B7494_g2618 [Chlorociboria aeruginascens]|nr:hypothetical protein B7494_g2618 [Chlorociboria aeruginascens]